MFDIVLCPECNYLLTNYCTYMLTTSIIKLDNVYTKILYINIYTDIYTNSFNFKKNVLGLTINNDLIDMKNNRILYSNVDDVVKINNIVFILTYSKIYKYDFIDGLIYINENIKEIICNNRFGYYVDNNNNKYVLDITDNNGFINPLGCDYKIFSDEIIEIEITNQYVLFILKDKIIIDNYMQYSDIYISKELINKYTGKDYYYIDFYNNIVKLDIEIIESDCIVNHGYLKCKSITFKNDMINIDNKQCDIYSLFDLIKNSYYVNYLNLGNFSIDKQNIQELVIINRSVFIKKYNKLFVYGKNNNLGINDHRKFIDEIIDTGLEFPIKSNVKSARKI